MYIYNINISTVGMYTHEVNVSPSIKNEKKHDCHGNNEVMNSLRYQKKKRFSLFTVIMNKPCEGTLVIFGY